MKDALLVLRRDGGARSVPVTPKQLEQFREIEMKGSLARIDARVVRSLVRLGIVEPVTVYRTKANWGTSR